jgi:hypothetical protein
MAEHMRAELVVEALAMAITQRHPNAGLVHHSDRGGQCVSLIFGQTARAAAIAVSMGAKGCALDNAVRRGRSKRPRSAMTDPLAPEAAQPPSLSRESSVSNSADSYDPLEDWFALELAAGAALLIVCDIGFRRTFGITFASPRGAVAVDPKPLQTPAPPGQASVCTGVPSAPARDELQASPARGARSADSLARRAESDPRAVPESPIPGASEAPEAAAAPPASMRLPPQPRSRLRSAAARTRPGCCRPGP